MKITIIQGSEEFHKFVSRHINGIELSDIEDLKHVSANNSYRLNLIEFQNLKATAIPWSKVSNVAVVYESIFEQFTKYLEKDLKIDQICNILRLEIEAVLNFKSVSPNKVRLIPVSLFNEDRESIVEVLNNLEISNSLSQVKGGIGIRELAIEYLLSVASLTADKTIEKLINNLRVNSEIYDHFSPEVQELERVFTNYNYLFELKEKNQLELEQLKSELENIRQEIKDIENERTVLKNELSKAHAKLTKDNKLETENKALKEENLLFENELFKIQEKAVEYYEYNCALRSDLEFFNKNITYLTLCREKLYLINKRPMRKLQTLLIKIGALLIPRLKRKITNEHIVNIISKSGEFDYKWYIEKYPDVKKAGMHPVIHYVKHGAVEGRNPNPKFNTNVYLERNSDVKESGINPFYHYIQFGKHEGRLGGGQ